MIIYVEPGLGASYLCNLDNKFIEFKGDPTDLKGVIEEYKQKQKYVNLNNKILLVSHYNILKYFIKDFDYIIIRKDYNKTIKELIKNGNSDINVIKN
jgi:hypothetical protein